MWNSSTIRSNQRVTVTRFDLADYSGPDVGTGLSVYESGRPGSGAAHGGGSPGRTGGRAGLFNFKMARPLFTQNRSCLEAFPGDGPDL